MARSADTYRGARRNACIRELKTVWNPRWYYRNHTNDPRWAIAKGLCAVGNQAPIYIPTFTTKRKKTRGKNEVYELIKRGDYAGATRKFFEPRTKASGRGK